MVVEAPALALAETITNCQLYTIEQQNEEYIDVEMDNQFFKGNCFFLFLTVVAIKD